MIINILTIFPKMFAPVAEESLLGKANEKGILDIRITDIREHTLDKHRKTDDYPFGGGAGMVMTADPIFNAMKSLGTNKKRGIYLSPRGKVLDQNLIEEIAKEDEIVLLCGHYEGVDERVLSYFNMEEISIGDYILTGGELPAMVLIDAVARFIPNVLGNENAHMEESIYSGLLEYPQYTKPREYNGMSVPEVLVSGNHKLIHLWQYEKSLELTKEKRPDLLKKYLLTLPELTKDEIKILNKFK